MKTASTSHTTSLFLSSDQHMLHYINYSCYFQQQQCANIKLKTKNKYPLDMMFNCKCERIFIKVHKLLIIVTAARDVMF